MLIDRKDFATFKQIAGQLIANLGSVSNYSLMMMESYPEHAQKIGIELNREVGDFARRMNSFMSGEMSNGAIIDECLILLRTFENILGRMEGN